MPVSPDRKREIMEERVKVVGERYNDWLDETLKEGFALYGIRPPRERLQGYMEGTLADDLPLVLDPDYLKKREVGIAPPLMVETMIEADMKATSVWQQVSDHALAAGQEAPPQPELSGAPMMWYLLLPPRLPPRAWQKIAADFRSLLLAEARKAEA